MVEMFAKLGAGQWFRYLTGALEVIGGVALLVPRAAFYGAVLLAAVMVGALVTHPHSWAEVQCRRSCCW
jgi:uncharacterized membrane protein YphA (DoxX/SURF4 family)